MDIGASERMVVWGERMVRVTRLEFCATRLLAHAEAAASREDLPAPAEAQALRDELERAFEKRPDICARAWIEKRAVILQFDACFSRREAERRAREEPHPSIGGDAA